jgi:methyltransferase-like protein 6
MELSEEQQTQLECQDKRLCDTFRADKFQRESGKHWDLFYKRNETRFFKDRHWTTREFQELLEENQQDEGCGSIEQWVEKFTFKSPRKSSKKV